MYDAHLWLGHLHQLSFHCKVRLGTEILILCDELQVVPQDHINNYKPKFHFVHYESPYHSLEFYFG